MQFLTSYSDKQGKCYIKVKFCSYKYSTRSRNCLPFASTCVHTFYRSLLLIFLVFCVVWYVSLRSEFRVVMSATMSTYKRCSFHLYLQLFVGRFMSYLRYLNELRIVVSKSYCVVSLLCMSSSCVHYVASFSGLSIFACLFGIR